MTIYELRTRLHRLGYPESYDVDKETYDTIEQYISNYLKQLNIDYPDVLHEMKFGKRGGLMFKNVELLVK